MYLSTAFVAMLLLPVLNAKSTIKKDTAKFDISTIEFVEVEGDSIELGFDTVDYLPENFDPHTNPIDAKSIDFIEVEEVILDFKTEAYLPKGFDPHN